MDGTRVARRVVAALRRAGGVHAGRFPAQQRLHLAAVLIALLCAGSAAAQDINFNPAITDEDFARFSRVVAQGIFPTPVQPARATGLLGFDVGIAATAVKVDTSDPYWVNSVGSDFTTSGYLGVPRIVASKGLSVATISASYAKLGSSDMKTWGGAIDVPIIHGTIATPEIAVRGSYGALTGSPEFDLKVYGVEGFISKGIGPFLPYGAIGMMRSDSSATIATSSVVGAPTFQKSSTSNVMRYTVGARFSLLVPKIAVEITKAEVMSYAAKLSFGF